MNSQGSPPREYDDDIDQLCQAFANASLSPAREAASRAGNILITSPPWPRGLPGCNTSKQNVNGGTNPFNVTSRTQRTKSCTAGREAINLNPDPHRKSSSAQGTAARQSLVIRLLLPHGMLSPQNGASNKANAEDHSSQSLRPSRAGGEEARSSNLLPIPARVVLLDPQNEISTSITVDFGSNPFTIPSHVYRRKARQLRDVLVPLHSRRRRPRNHLNVLRPNPFMMPSRGQREAVIKAVKSLRALEPSFCDLPAELRLMIYEYALASESPITPRLEGPQKAESKRDPADTAECSAQAKASSLALLQTCRLVNREARPVYYANNTFRFTCATDLLNFLSHLEPDLLNKLQKLHIEGLLTYKPTFTEEFLRPFRAAMSDAAYRDLASMRMATLSEHATVAAPMLRKCTRLRRIRLAMGPNDEFTYILWLRVMSGYCMTTVEFVNDDYWVLRSASMAVTFEWFDLLLTAVTDQASYRALFPVIEEGKRRCIDVDLGIDWVKNEMWSGVCPRAIREARIAEAC